VSNNKEIVVKDACILFDLIDLDLISPFFELDLIVLTTPQVIAEITDPTQFEIVSGYLENKRLIVDAWGQLDSIDAILHENKGLSFADGSVLELAIRKSAVLLSSDGSLRKISVNNGLVVRGVLWIIEELFRKEFITKEQAVSTLDLYPKINYRAPSLEIKKLLERLKDL
jgi:predicted nucleic acid-binding protein